MEATGKQTQAMGAVFKRLMSLETRDGPWARGEGHPVLVKGLRAEECDASDECRGHRLSQCVDSPGPKNNIPRKNSQGLKKRNSDGCETGGGRVPGPNHLIPGRGK